MGQKGVTEREIMLALQFGKVVEIHNEANEPRVVIRHAYGRPKVAVCVVFGLESGAVVTTWKNNGHDNHKTLDRSAYSWRVDALQVVAALAFA
jgi:hypothetical protein